MRFAEILVESGDGEWVRGREGERGIDLETWLESKILQFNNSTIQQFNNSTKLLQITVDFSPKSVSVFYI